MKITAAHITDFKRVRDVTIAPDADTYLLLIGGENDAGKTSVLDAIESALGGKASLPTKAVRRGAEQASIVVELDGVYRIERIVPLDGDSKLVVTGPDGRIARPQEWLNKLMGACFLDPLAFLTAPAEKQRKTLAALVGVDLDGFAAERKKAYDERTAVGQLLKRAEGELQRLPPVSQKPAAARSQAAIRGDLDSIEAEHRAIDAKRAARMKAEAGQAALEDRAARLRGEIARLQDELDGLAPALEAGRAHLDAAVAAVDAAATPAHFEALDRRRAELVAESGRAETLARWEAAAEQTNRRRRDAEEETQRHAAERDRLTATIDDVDRRKAAALAAAPMPVEGLGIDDDGLTLDGLPFDQASKSGQMKCALAIAMAMQPNLKDILVRDASLIGEARLADLHIQAMFAGCRLWLERVGEKDEGAIIIRDGLVAGGAA